MTRDEFKRMEKRLATIEQAILELAAALREAGIRRRELALPSPDDHLVPAPLSADDAFRLLGVNIDDYEKLVGIERNVPRAPTRRDIDRLRRKRLSRPWKGMLAKRKKA